MSLIEYSLPQKKSSPALHWERRAANQRGGKRYTTRELRDEFPIQNLYQSDQVQAVYSHVDRMITLGIISVEETVPIDKGLDVWHNFCAQCFLERREAGFFNLGGEGVCTVDGTDDPMGMTVLEPGGYSLST